MRAAHAVALLIRLIAKILAAHPAMQAPSISERPKRSMYNRCVFIAPETGGIIVMRGGAVKPLLTRFARPEGDRRCMPTRLHSAEPGDE